MIDNTEYLHWHPVDTNSITHIFNDLKEIRQSYIRIHILPDTVENPLVQSLLLIIIMIEFPRGILVENTFHSLRLQLKIFKKP